MNFCNFSTHPLLKYFLLYPNRRVQTIEMIKVAKKPKLTDDAHLSICALIYH